jgi:hypothetical protein
MSAALNLPTDQEHVTLVRTAPHNLLGTDALFAAMSSEQKKG